MKSPVERGRRLFFRKNFNIALVFPAESEKKEGRSYV